MKKKRKFFALRAINFGVRKKIVKEILVYLLIFYSISFLVIFFLKNHYSKNFSPLQIEEMITNISRFRNKTDNPCLYSIAGDPVNSMNDYLKVNLYCNEKEKSLNTLSLKAVKDKTIEGVIREIGRVNGFRVITQEGQLLSLGALERGKYKKWYCFIDGNPIKTIKLQIPKGKTLECFWASDNEIKKIIEKLKKKWLQKQ